MQNATIRIFPVLLVSGFVLFSCHREKPGSSLPNIIYILTDDMGYGDVSAFNEHAAWKTPNMDRLAEEGMIFTDAHSGSAVCTPTRYGILTGRYSWRTHLKEGVLWSRDTLLITPGRMTVASLLKGHGYTTACIGKWHLGLGWQYADNHPGSIDFSKPLLSGPHTTGFDYSYIITASLDIPPYVYIENGKSTTVPHHYTESHDKYGWWRKGLTGDDFIHEEVLPHLTERSLDFIRKQAKSGNPFFLYFPMNAPHTPILPTRDFRGKSGTNPYGDYVLEVDAMIGKVMHTIDSLGLKENTLFIVTSDNGCSPQADYKILAGYGHNPSYIFRGTKSDIWEGGHRIPFIARWPGVIRNGSSCDETICLTDLLATCAAITGDPLPDYAGEDSYSLLPLFRGYTLTSAFREATVHHSINGYFSLRRGKWKLEMCSGSGGWSHPTPEEAREAGLPPVQLYDIVSDPAEQKNIAEAFPGVVDSLKGILTMYILEGRSTPGKSQPYVVTENWPGLEWMKKR
ncbi:MAG: arylsulfatase [Chlorobi bacterium]|nr:arylsulfatase [Chlorobiota bacterium]